MFRRWRSRSELAQLEHKFRFLVSFGYRQVSGESSDQFRGRNLVVHRSDAARKQIEIWGDARSTLRALVRRIGADGPAPYGHREHTLDVIELAVLEDPTCDTTAQYYAIHGLRSRREVRNLVALMKRHRTFFTSASWVDGPELRQARDANHRHRFGTPRPPPRVSLVAEGHAIVTEVLPGSKVEFDSTVLPPYHVDSLPERAGYTWRGHRIGLAQVDYRDEALRYRLLLDEAERAELDITGMDAPARAGALRTALEQLRTQLP